MQLSGRICKTFQIDLLSCSNAVVIDEKHNPDKDGHRDEGVEASLAYELFVIEDLIDGQVKEIDGWNGRWFRM